MDTFLGEMQPVTNIGSSGPREWVHDVIGLLEAAVSQLHHEQACHDTESRLAQMRESVPGTA